MGYLLYGRVGSYVFTLYTVFFMDYRGFLMDGGRISYVIYLTDRIISSIYGMAGIGKGLG